MAVAFAPAVDLQGVTKVLLEFEECPEVARKMFAAGLSNAVARDGAADAGAARHDFQVRFLVATQNAVRDAHRSAVEKEAAALECAKTAEVELAAQQTVSKEATKVEQEAVVDTQSKASILQETKQQVAKSEREYKKVEEGKARFCKERDQVKQEYEQHSAIADGPLRMLSEGGWEDDEVKDSVIEAVVTHLQSFKADDVLLAAAPSALGTKPASRHPFDTITVECILSAFEAQGKKFTARLAEGEAEERLTLAHALGMWAVADVARDAQQTATGSSDAAAANLEIKAGNAQVEAKKAADKENAVVAIRSQHALAVERVQATQEAVVALERMIANEYKSAETEPAKDVMMEAEPVKDVIMEEAISIQASEPVAVATKMEEDQPAGMASPSLIAGA